MPTEIPEGIKFQIVKQWLQGKFRNDIAAGSGKSWIRLKHY
jgi:hypothetical protein